MFNWIVIRIRRVVQSLIDGYKGDGKNSHQSNSIPSIKIGLITGMNGKILEVSVPNTKRSSYGDDWIYDYYIVGDDQKISEAMAVVMIMKGLDK